MSNTDKDSLPGDADAAADAADHPPGTGDGRVRELDELITYLNRPFTEEELTRMRTDK